MQPLLPDAPVQVQQQNPDLTWTTVATGTVNADGTFSLPVALASGGDLPRHRRRPRRGTPPATTPPQIVAR